MQSGPSGSAINEAHSARGEVVSPRYERIEDPEDLAAIVPAPICSPVFSFFPNRRAPNGGRASATSELPSARPQQPAIHLGTAASGPRTGAIGANSSPKVKSENLTEEASMRRQHSPPSVTSVLYTLPGFSVEG